MKHSVKQNIGLVVIGCVIGLLILELIIRKLNMAPYLIENLGSYRLIDNPKMVYGLTPMTILDNSTINKQGFKDVDFTINKPANIVRIAMLGDSITEGMRILLGKTFSDKLEMLLNQKSSEQKSNLRYEVMNFGVGGYNLEAEVENLKTNVLQYSPDIVVLNFSPNDNESIPGIHLWFVNDNGLSEEQKLLIYKRCFSKHSGINRFFYKKILSKSKLYLFLMDRASVLYKGLSGFSSFIKANYGTGMTTTDINKMYSYLCEIERLKKEHNF